MKRRRLLLSTLGLAGCGSPLLSTVYAASQNPLAGTPIEGIDLRHMTASAAAPIVYYCPKVSAQSLINLFGVSGFQLKDKVGIKMTFENASAKAVKLNPDLIRPFVQQVKGTLIDSNYFDSARSNVRRHLETAKENGYADVGPIDILDAEGEIRLPVKGGYHLKNLLTGSHLKDYGTLISIVRFKGHNLARYGGTVKNPSICLGTAGGASQIHSGGKVEDHYSAASDKVVSESMADAVKAALDYKPGRWLFFNVLDAIEPQRRDDCKDAKNLGDLGILMSTDPIACDQTAVDIVYGFAPNEQIRNQWEKDHHTDSLSMAEKIGVGSTKYRLQVIR